MAELDEAELTRLQNASVAVVGAALSGNPKHTFSPAAGAVLLAVPALTDEVRHYRAENARLREALRLACQDLRGPGVPVDDLMADYLRAAETAPDDAQHETPL